MRHRARLERVGAALRRQRQAIDNTRIPVYIVNDAGKRITPAMYGDGSGIDYRHDLWMVTDEAQQIDTD